MLSESLRYVAVLLQLLMMKGTNKKKPLLEDTFESFFGATEWLIDSFIEDIALKQGNNTTYVGVGYNIINGILTTLFDKN